MRVLGRACAAQKGSAAPCCQTHLILSLLHLTGNDYQITLSITVTTRLVVGPVLGGKLALEIIIEHLRHDAAGGSIWPEGKGGLHAQYRRLPYALQGKMGNSDTWR